MGSGAGISRRRRSVVSSGGGDARRRQQAWLRARGQAYGANAAAPAEPLERPLRATGQQPQTGTLAKLPPSRMNRSRRNRSMLNSSQRNRSQTDGRVATGVVETDGGVSGAGGTGRVKRSANRRGQTQGRGARGDGPDRAIPRGLGVTRGGWAWVEIRPRALVRGRTSEARIPCRRNRNGGQEPGQGCQGWSQIGGTGWTWHGLGSSRWYGTLPGSDSSPSDCSTGSF